MNTFESVKKIVIPTSPNLTSKDQLQWCNKLVQRHSLCFPINQDYGVGSHQSGEQFLPSGDMMIQSLILSVLVRGTLGCLCFDNIREVTIWGAVHQNVLSCTISWYLILATF